MPGPPKPAVAAPAAAGLTPGGSSPPVQGSEAAKRAAAKQALLATIERELASLQVQRRGWACTGGQQVERGGLHWQPTVGGPRRLRGAALRDPPASSLRTAPSQPPRPRPQARIAETEAEIGTPLLGALSTAEQAELRQLQPQVTQLQVRRGGREDGGALGQATRLPAVLPGRQRQQLGQRGHTAAHAASARAPHDCPRFFFCCLPQEELEGVKAQLLEVEAQAQVGAL